MTARRRPDGDLEEVKSSLTTNGFRWGLLVLVASMHPLGRQALSMAGFQLNTTEVKTAEQVVKTDDKVKKLDEDIAAIKLDVAGVKSDVKDVKAKVDQISMFQVDFERWKAQPGSQPR